MNDLKLIKGKVSSLKNNSPIIIDVTEAAQTGTDMEISNFNKVYEHFLSGYDVFIKIGEGLVKCFGSPDSSTLLFMFMDGPDVVTFSLAKPQPSVLPPHPGGLGGLG